ncbi:MAG: carboxypeptidase T [Patiriisocius sp.]|jgi:carboxypeptidase T
MLLSAQLYQAQTAELYHRAKIFYNGQEEFVLLNSMGVEMDHGKHKKGVFIESDFSETELKSVSSAGFEIEILISDVTKFYVERSENTKVSAFNKNESCTGNSDIIYETPENFELGSMAGFFTYDEILAELDAMAEQFPNIITNRETVSDFTTIEGRPLYWLRMSDNPNTDEDEPEMMYDAVHHAREPASVSTLIHYMWYLLENYDSDPEVQAIIDNTQLYFIPVVNPDGYVHNITTNPNGGGLWRKNRRVHDDGEFGVDNNRNYGYEWGTNGISFNTSSAVYCGEDAFSEAENQAMKWFCENHEFQIVFNNHSYSNLLLFPYGWEEGAVTEDHDIYTAISTEMVSQNGYANINGWELYPASGVSDDWMYTETPEKNKIYSFTPEIGSSAQGFWPSSVDIIPLCQSVMYMNLTAAHMITKYASVADLTDQVLEDINGSLSFEIKRLGLQDSDFSVSVNSISSNITVNSDDVVFNGLDLLATSESTFDYTLNSDIQVGDIIEFQYAINNGDYIQLTEVFAKTFGAPSSVFFDDGTDISNWDTTPWNITTEDFVSSPSSYTDSPNDDYNNNENTSIVLDTPIDLLDAAGANLTFSAKWDIEQGWDYLQVEVSIDNGNNWIPQCGLYTVIGNDEQAEGQPLYDGVQNDWVQETISLSDYLDEEILIRFQLVSDGFTTGDGFYFDDLSINVLDGSVGIGQLNESSFILSQNQPNPAQNLTRIDYLLPQDLNNSSIILFNNTGQEIQKFLLTQSNGSVLIDTKKIAAGTYYYSLNNNDFMITTRKMIIIK